MTKKESGQIENLTAKVDLLYSLLSNNLQAIQALQVNTAVKGQIDHNPKHENLEQLKQMETQSFEAYKFHSESVNHGIDFFANTFGEESQKRYNKLIKEAAKTAETAVNNTEDSDNELQKAAKMAEDTLATMRDKK